MKRCFVAFAITCWLVTCWLVTWHTSIAAEQVLVEAESFADPGGWVLDTQAITAMGSPYLLAHGLGRPVKDATTQLQVPSAGTYRIFVRTKDWVARWKAPGQPGRFQLWVNGHPLKETFGTKGVEWFWHDGGTVTLDGTAVTLTLHDLTGFEGRCDAVLLSRDLSFTPPADPSILPSWRRQLLELPDKPIERSGYDLVVVGGGYSGLGAAISAARMGCRVALLQNRPVLGGNGSSEVRVWAQGLIRRGTFPRVGEIVEEFADSAKKSPGETNEFGDPQKEKLVRNEKNIDLMLNHHAYQVEMDGQRISAVLAFDTRTGQRVRVSARLFADCTGHGTLGYLAGADWEMTPKKRMGMSNMWAWTELDHAVEFPETPWALNLEMKDFPYPRDHHGQWFWESGFDKDPIREAEAIRDWNLRAVYGAFNAMKNRGGRDQHRSAQLTWIAFIGGPRESRRLMGDVRLSKEDVVGKRQFPDGIVPSTWSIDLHYAKKQYAKKFPDNPFISVAEFDSRVDRLYGYPIPYRCFYSRNVDNLFMAGRCISVTHEALGTVRVMKTCGMMGEVVGKASSICALHECWPRDVYSHYLDDLKQLCRLPGKSRRATVSSPLEIPEDVPVASAEGPPSGIDPNSLAGVVVDDIRAERTGTWGFGTGLKGYVGHGYVYSADPSSAITFTCKAPTAGRYEVRIAYRAHENRGKDVSVTVRAGEFEKTEAVNMQIEPPLKNGFLSLCTVALGKGESCSVVIRPSRHGEHACADAVQLVPVK